MTDITETATVYRMPGQRRRFFSRRASVNDYCWKKIKSRHPCECEGDVGYTCGWHQSPGFDYMEKLKVRYFRACMRWTRKARKQ